MRRTITLTYEPSSDPREARFVMLAGGRRWLRCRVRSSGPTLRPCGEALLCFGLLPAIELGCDLCIEAPVDRHLLATIDGLVTIVGADVSITDRPLAAWLAGIAGRVAEGFGVEAIVVETDGPEQIQPFLGWIEYHGSTLAGIRHLLADRFATMRVAASADAATMWDTPWGSHPGLDPHLGTSAATIALDGLVTRPEKIARLLGEPLLLENLRVCYRGGPNCGACGKCVVTRICLDVLGGGRPLPSFPAGRPPLDREALHVSDTSARNDRLALRAAAVAAGGHARLVSLLDAAVAEFDSRRPSLVERLHLKERLRVARHRWRFGRTGG